MRSSVYLSPGPCPMWKRLIVVLVLMLLAVGGWFGWERWQQHQLSKLSDDELAARKKDERAIRERIARAGVRDNPAAAAAAWVELSLLRPNDPDPQLRASIAWEAAGQPTNAYSSLNQAYKKWPKDLRVLQARAAFFERQQDRPQAIKTFHEWLQVQPGSVDARVHLADALYAAGTLEDAATHYQAALDKDPKLESPRRRLALISLLRGDLEAAQSHTQAVLAGSNPAGINHQLKAELQLATAGKAALSSAIEDLELSLVRQPELTSSSYLLAYLQELKDDYKAAAAQYRRLLARDPYHRGGTYRLARVLDRIGSPQEAAKLLTRHQLLAQAHGEVQRLTSALSASPGDQELSLQLARSFRVLGRFEDAMSSYSVVLRARPNDAALQKEVQPLMQQLAPAAGQPGNPQP